MIREYSLKRDGAVSLSRNFKVREFACHDGADKILNCEELVRMLQVLREHLDAPLTIISGYRTLAWNKRVGGAPNSYHTKGQAADIRTPAMAPAALYALIDGGKVPGIDPKIIGLGRYPTFVHIDSRGYRGRW